MTFLQELEVGAQCERKYRAYSHFRTKKEIARRLSLVRQQHKKANKNELRWPHARQSFRRSPDFQDYQEDVRSALQEMQGIDLIEDDSEPNQIIKFVQLKPRVKRRTIIAEVASATNLPPSRVDKCWKLFRAVTYP